jgi:hypothetical protein
MKRITLIAALLLAGCSTEQKPTSFPVEISASVPSGPTEVGWTVQLDAAFASVGPVRFYPGHVLLADRVKRWMWMPFGGVAQAHPGHYIPGEALAEVLNRKVIDLLSASPVVLGVADGVTGDYGSLQLSLLPPVEGIDTQGVLGGHSLRLKGTAQKDAQSVTFDAFVDLSAPIEGIRSEATVGEGSTRVRIDFHLKRWLDRVDFSTATGSPATFADGSQALNALFRGASDTGAYVVTWGSEAQQ